MGGEKPLVAKGLVFWTVLENVAEGRYFRLCRLLLGIPSGVGVESCPTSGFADDGKRSLRIVAFVHRECYGSAAVKLSDHTN